MDLVLTILFGGILIVLAVWAYFLKRKERSLETEALKQQEGYVNLGDNAEPYFFDLLKEMGCSPAYTDEKTRRISFQYQGHAFVLRCNGRPYCMIWSYSWGVLDLPDSRMNWLMRCVNYANYNSPYSTYYYIDEESKSMVLMTSCTLHFPNGHYKMKDYLTEVLDGFFTVQHCVRSAFEDEKLRKEREADQKSVNSGEIWN